MSRRPQFRNATTIFSFVLLLYSACGFAQAHMAESLNTQSDTELSRTLTQMGVTSDVVESYRTEPERPLLSWVPLQIAKQSFALLFIPCKRDSAYLYLMKETGSEWHAVDHAEFDCHYDLSVSVSAVFLRYPNISEILVHHACDIHGTGLLQQNFKVLNVRNDRFKVVLDTEEVLQVNRVPLGSYEMSQTSTFTLVPSALSKAIEETRSTTLNGKLSVRRRYFRWSAGQGRYVASKFAPVVAR